MSLSNPAPDDLTALWLNSYRYHREQRCTRDEAVTAASEFMRGIMLPQRADEVALTCAEMESGKEVLA